MSKHNFDTMPPPRVWELAIGQPVGKWVEGGDPCEMFEDLLGEEAANFLHGEGGEYSLQRPRQG
jgi:hypothetical protein